MTDLPLPSSSTSGETATTPRRLAHLPPEDPNTCPNCNGDWHMLEGGECATCRNTGRIYLPQPSEDIRHHRKFCYCTQVSPNGLGIPACPLCGGEGVADDLDLAYAYRTVLEHWGEAVRPGADTVVLGEPLARIVAKALWWTPGWYNNSATYGRVLLSPVVTRSGEKRYQVWNQNYIYRTPNLLHAMPIMGPAKFGDVEQYLRVHLHLPQDWWVQIPEASDLCRVCHGMPMRLPGGKGHCVACQDSGKRRMLGEP